MHIVVLVHGIRTRGMWYDIATPVLEECSDVTVRHVSYGYFDTIKFLFPWGTRAKPINRLRSQIKALYEIEADTEIRISVIAHSFGTYCITSILQNNDDVVLENLVLCNSIVETHFSFDDVRTKIKGNVVNEVGFKDVWPVMAKISSLGYGYSGTFGFGDTLCMDRHHDIDHGGFFDFSTIHKYWCPLFVSGKLVKSDFNRNSRIQPGLIRYLSMLPEGALFYLFIIISVAALFFLLF